MKKIKLFALLAISSLLLNAQPYAHHLYSHANSRLTTGLHTSINSPGFFMIGSHVPTVPRPFNFSVDKTDVGGVLSGSTFIQKQYQIMTGGASCSSNLTQSQNGEVSGIETNIPGTPAGWYALAGAFDQSIFFATLDASGLPITTVAYDFPMAGGSSKPIIVESSVTPNEYYITGTYGTPVGPYIYVLKVNATGGIIWSQMFNDPNINLIETWDMVESPYTSEVLIVGHVNLPQSFNRATDGFILRVDQGTGNFINYICYGGPGSSCDSFQAITVANSTYGGTSGFVIVGSMDPFSGPGQAWILKIDPTGGYIWTTEFSPSTDPTARLTLDVIERLNQSGVYEYYAVFQRSPSGMGVGKFDDSGAPFPGGVNNEFVYDLGASRPLSISFENTAGGPDEGIHVYGTENSGTGDHYLVEAYFSGESGCNETLTLMNSSPGPNTLINVNLNQNGNLTPCTNFALNPVIYDDYPVSDVCSSPSIPGGSNARSAVTGINEAVKNETQFQVAPNPTSGNALITYSLKKESRVKIELFNYLGQYIKTIQPSTTQSKGDYTSKLELNVSGVESGVYIVQFTIDNKVSQEKIVYAK